jgi:hypothetical protein
MKRYVKAASEKDEALDAAIDDLKSDFDYIVDGLDKLSRDGVGKEALTIALNLSAELSNIISQIANLMDNNS